MANNDSGILNNPQYIPKTKRRTALSVGLFYTKVNPSDWIDLIFDTSFWKEVAAGLRETSLVKIGSLEVFGDNEERDISVHHELDADISGQIIGVVPKNIDGTLTINRALLYTAGTGDILEAIGYSNETGWTLKNQTKPFIIVKIEVSPLSDRKIVTIWSGCFLRNNPKEYSITGELKVIQNIEIKYAAKNVYVS